MLIKCRWSSEEGGNAPKGEATVQLVAPIHNVNLEGSQRKLPEKPSSEERQRLESDKYVEAWLRDAGNLSCNDYNEQESLGLTKL